MLVRRVNMVVPAILLVVALFGVMPAGTALGQEKALSAKICINCHKPEAGNMRGYFENAAFKSQSIQLKMDDATEIVKFDPETLKVMIEGQAKDAEALRGIAKNHEVRIEYAEKDGVKRASLVSSKPPIKVPAEQLVSTEEMMKLVAMGPEKGKYFLVDSRPAPRFYEGAIPTAENIPDVAFDANKDKLPTKKDILLIFYCGGFT